ncbi:MAG: Crp/Fnr family transcriptional regulator [Chitinophagaceae bacterium]|nr:MAG: Crp/Fnr family transcriptional regulator [Bacteroidetes bacterium OLB11]MCC6448795.1 Crp/Fnr family transcriptional regulator [Chitinophagaceae bacterium]HMN31926.1 Crp/Fnr family transcriptional regulator [Chitinophagaceae bacterium]
MQFQQFLTQNTQFSDDEITKMLSLCMEKEFKKGSLLVREGDKPLFSFFVEKGLLKQYTIDAKGKEHILLFAPENWFVSIRESEFFNLPSSYFIEAIEDTVVYLIKHQFLFELSLKEESFLRFNDRLLHNHILHLQKRITFMQSASAEDRYIEFINLYPDITYRVPQSMIASYLGIAPESLSRIRKELSDKKE